MSTPLILHVSAAFLVPASVMLTDEKCSCNALQVCPAILTVLCH